MKTLNLHYCLLVISLFTAAPGRATTLQLRVILPGATNEFNLQAELEWDGQPNVNYKVYGTSSLKEQPPEWKCQDLVKSSQTGPVKWMAPEAMSGSRFYRVSAEPLITDIQPSFIDSSNSGSLLYLSGQLLPSNGIVVINGQNFSGTTDSNGVLSVSLNGLPPGTPVTGTISVLDAASNVVATLPVQSPIYYGTTAPPELLQGSPEEPPASPQALGIAIWASKKGYDYWKARSELSSAIAIFAGKRGYDYYQAQSSLSSIITIWASKKGYDYYKAQSDLSATGLQNNPAFKDNSNQGEMLSGVAIPKFLDYMKKGRSPSDMMASRQTPEDCDDTDRGIFPATGEFRCHQTDLVISGAMLDFAWTRTYRSRTGPTTAQGANWDFSFNVSLTQNGDGTITLRPGNGRADTFYPYGTNWVREGYFCEIRDLNNDAYPDVLFADTGKWLFHPSGPASGKLAQIIDRNGNSISLNYDRLGRLAQIVDDLGRTNSVGYDTSGHIASVTDFSGRSVRYEYDTNGDLVSVISPPVTGTPTGNDFPGGITNRYTYSSGFANASENHLLLSVIDGKGQVQSSHVYQHNQTDLEFLRCISVQEGTNPPTQYRFFPRLPTHLREYATGCCIANDPVGNVSESDFDSRGRCVALREFTGRATPGVPVTDTVNRPTGKLHADDPDYFEMQWAWNRDSLCTLETLPDGGKTRFTYESDFDSAASARKKGDCRVVRKLAAPGGGADLDGDGVNDISELAWRFEYDPRFGSPTAKTGGRRIAAASVLANALLCERILTSGNPGINSPLPDTYLHAARHGWDGTIKGRPPEAGRQFNPARDYLIGDTAIYNNPIYQAYSYSGTKWEKVDNSESPISSRSSSKSNGMKIEDGWSCSASRLGVGPCFPIPGDGFVISATDPRGNVATASYNALGGIIRRTHFAQSVAAEYDAAIEERFAYNPRGQLTAVTNALDAHGFRRVDTFSYYTNGPQSGQLQSVVVDDRALLGLREQHAFEYDTVGNLTRYVDPCTNDWLFTYNALDQCIMAQTPVNKTARTTHFANLDASGNLTDSGLQLRDENDVFIRNVTTHYDYDTFNRCIAIVGQASPGNFITNRFEYDANDNLIAALSPLAANGEDPHAMLAFEYDERGLLFREISAPGGGQTSTNQYDYDQNCDRFRVKVTASTYIRSTFIQRDGLRRVSSVADPMGNETRFNYDRNGNCTLVRFYGETNDVPGSAGNILLAKSSYKYDGRDNVVQCATTHFRTSGAPVGDGLAITTFAYAPNGDLTSVTDDNGNSTTYGYDAIGRVTSTSSPGCVCTCTPGFAGPSKIIVSNFPDSGGAPQVFTTEYAYDSKNRCIANWDNVGNTNRYAYDSLSRLVRETDPRGVATVAEYDDLGYTSKLWVDQNADGTITSNELVQTRTRNVPRLLIVLTDGNANSTRYGYDSLGNCTSITNADNTVTKLIWSPRSNLVRVEDPNGTVVTNIYDLNDRLIHRDISVGAGVAATTTFEHFAYDGAGQCVLAQNNSSTNTFEYDSLGNCVRETHSGWMIGHLHDNLGRRISTTYPSGMTVNYAYNASDDVTNISVSAGTTTTPLASFAYDGPGCPRSFSYHNGASTAIKRSGRVGAPNAPGDFGWQQVASIAHSTAMGPFWTGTNKWDAAQNSTQRNNFQLGALAVEDSINFALDGDNRLVGSLRSTNSVATRFVNYVLDINGNRQLVQDNGIPQVYTMENAIPPGDFQMNRYTQTPFGAQAYDLNGNLISRISTMAQTFYEYDYADRLVSVGAFDAGSGSIVSVASYEYDAPGQRIRKTVPSSSAMLPPVVTEYLNLQRLGGDILIHGDSAIAETYVNGALLDSFVHKEDDGLTIYRSRAGGPSAFYHSDDLGNTVALTDESGNVVERYTYDDFGLPHFLSGTGEVVATNSSPVGNPILFLGLEWESETGFLHDGTGNNYNPLTGSSRRGYTATARCDTPLGCDRTASDGNPWSLNKEEGGRHTPFHNKYRPQFSSAIIHRNILKSFFQTGDKPTQD